MAEQLVTKFYDAFLASPWRNELNVNGHRDVVRLDGTLGVNTLHAEFI